MVMRSKLGLILLLALVVVAARETTRLSMAAPDTQIAPLTSCAPMVRQALERVSRMCDGLSRNQACYGNRAVQVEARPNVNAFRFDDQGDIADLDLFARIQTSAYDALLQTWGIVLLKAQVNLPTALPGQNITFLLFGDTEIDADTPDMQVFSVQTRVGAVQCDALPNSGLIIQTPAGQRAQMQINGTEIILGSTAMLTASAHGEMVIALLEGHSEISAHSVTRILTPGTEVRIALGGDDGMQAQSAPSEAQPYADMTDMEPMLALLERDFELPETTANALCVPMSLYGYSYIVQPGDTFSLIAAQSSVSIEALATANCIENVSFIVVGQVLSVPLPISTPISISTSGADNSAVSGGDTSSDSGRRDRTCGDGICVPGENRNTCPIDCPVNAPRDENGYRITGNDKDDD